MRTWRNNIARSKPKGNGTSTFFENTAPWRRWIQHSSVFSRTLPAICCNVLPQLYHLNLMTALLDDLLLGMKDNDSRKVGRCEYMWKYHEIGWNRCRFAWDMLGFFWQDAWVPATGFLRRRGQDMHDGAWGASKSNVASRSFLWTYRSSWFHALVKGDLVLEPFGLQCHNWILAIVEVKYLQLILQKESWISKCKKHLDGKQASRYRRYDLIWIHYLGANTLSHIWMPAIHTCSNQLLIWS